MLRFVLQVLAEVCGPEITERLMLPTVLNMSSDMVSLLPRNNLSLLLNNTVHCVVNERRHAD